MANQVQFVIDADAAKAVEAAVRFAGAMGKPEVALERMVKKGKEVGGVMSGIGSSMLSWAGGLAAGASAATLWNNWTQNLVRARQQTVGFEGEMTELLSLGDNMSAIPQLKQQVLDYSAGWGMSRRQIIEDIAQGDERFFRGCSLERQRGRGLAPVADEPQGHIRLLHGSGLPHARLREANEIGALAGEVAKQRLSGAKLALEAIDEFKKPALQAPPNTSTSEKRHAGAACPQWMAWFGSPLPQ